MEVVGTLPGSARAAGAGTEVRKGYGPPDPGMRTTALQLQDRDSGGLRHTDEEGKYQQRKK